VTCHEGIEQAHGPIAETRCSICHGGDPTIARRGTAPESAPYTQRKQEAHVAIPSNWSEVRGDLPPSPDGFIRDFVPSQLDAIDPAYLQFINPSDTRVVEGTCGICHPSHVATMPNSVMATNVGHYYPTLFLAGQQDDRTPIYGSVPATDPDCDPNLEGTVCSLEPLEPYLHGEVEALFAEGVPEDDELLRLAYHSYLSKKCASCHQSGFNRNNSPGLYRSTGCASCHFVYDKLGIYEGGDPTIPKGVPVHPRRHEITDAIPAEHCASCHFQGGRIGLLFRGIREGGFGDAYTPPHAEPVPETLHGHAPGFYFSDEDTTNDVDETPPDVHFQKGLHCVDCHVGRDVHGDGRIYGTSKHQVSIRCEDCHGTVRERATPDEAGAFWSYKGNHLKQLHQASDGSVVLTGRLDGVEHTVPQPSDLLAEGGEGSDAMHRAMGEDVHGWSHTDNLTCDTCHNSYVQYCIGCHVTYDLRLDEIDFQLGTATPGLTRGSRTAYTLEHMLLGRAPDGRAQVVHPSQQLQMSVFGDADYGTGEGELLHGGMVDDGEGGTKAVGKFREAHGFVANLGFAPLFQHTTSRAGRACSTCHRRDNSPEETSRIRGVYGFGTGEFMLQGHDGNYVYGLRFLDDDGNPTTAWPHTATGPLSEEVRTRAMGVLVEDSAP